MTYSDIKVTGRTISFQMSGSACDTAQLYISYPTAATDPAVPSKVLRYFEKFCTTAGVDSTTVSYTLADADVSNWDVAKGAYTVTAGKFGVHVGASSVDIRLTAAVTVA